MVSCVNVKGYRFRRNSQELVTSAKRSSGGQAIDHGDTVPSLLVPGQAVKLSHDRSNILWQVTYSKTHKQRCVSGNPDKAQVV